MRIVILGWGSLIWAPRHLPITGKWHEGGPKLPIEFSRISQDGRLTLVIDPEHGTPVPTRYAQSAREVPDDAIDDLRRREGTIRKRVGYVSLRTGEQFAQDKSVAETIKKWTLAAGFDATVWTDLPSNFKEKTGNPFSVQSGVEYLRTLSGDKAATAREYIAKAPSEVDTALRQRLRESGLE